MVKNPDDYTRFTLSHEMAQAIWTGMKTTHRYPLFPRKGASTKPEASPWKDIKPGAMLYVREPWLEQQIDNDHESIRRAYYPSLIIERTDTGIYHGTEIQYRGTVMKEVPDPNPPKANAWLRQMTAMEMPKWAARLHLIVKSVSIVDLLPMSEEALEKEGMSFGRWNSKGMDRTCLVNPYKTWAERYKMLWDQSHRNAVYDSNPKVVKLAFDVVRKGDTGPEMPE